MNTASAPVMAAALVGNELTSDQVTDGRPYSDAAALCSAGVIQSAYFSNGNDDDGGNDGDDAGEKLEWAIRSSNVFTLRSNVFSATVSGQIQNAGGDALAKRSYHVICRRGKELTADGAPKVEIVSTTSAD